MTDHETVALLRRALIQNNRILQTIFDALPEHMYDAKACLRTRAEANNEVLGRTDLPYSYWEDPVEVSDGPDPDKEMEKRFAQENAAKHGIEYADDDG